MTSFSTYLTPEDLEQDFRNSPLSERSILDIQYLKNANGGDARTLEDVGFRTCLDLFTYWFFEKENLKKLLDKPIVPWRVCNLDEGFEERVLMRYGKEAEDHLEKLLKSEDQEGELFEVFQNLEDLNLEEKHRFKSIQNLYIYWNYQPKHFGKLLEGESAMSLSGLILRFQGIKDKNSDLAWKILDSLLRKRTAFISHLLLES